MDIHNLRELGEMNGFTAERQKEEKLFLFYAERQIEEKLFLSHAERQIEEKLFFSNAEQPKEEKLFLSFAVPGKESPASGPFAVPGKKNLTSGPLEDDVASLPPGLFYFTVLAIIAGVCYGIYKTLSTQLYFDETNLPEKHMELPEELEQGQLKSAQLQRKIKEQEINLEKKKSRSAQLQQKIKEQEIKLNQPGRLPCYRMSRRPRGICVIINNINFRGECKRVGAEFDEIELARLYTELQFEVHPFRDLQWDEMRRVAVDFSKKDHSQFDAFAFIVMSHGGDKDVIYGVSGRHTRVEDLMSEFKAANCPTLRNKPKLFIIQTCRGSSNDSLSPASCGSDTAAVFSPDSTLARSVCPQEADFLLSFATAPGYKAWRYPGFGTPYIQFLVQEIRKHHHSHHLLDILTEVNRRVVEDGIRDGKSIQCPAPTHTLQGQVFL